MNMDLPSVDWRDPATTVLALLLCGHALADLLFQSDEMVRQKQRSLRVLAIHGLIVGVVQGCVVLPFSWSLRGLLLISGIALTHFVIDGIRVLFDRKLPRHGLSWLFLDQAAHLGVLLLVWNLWAESEVPESVRLVGRGATLLTVILFSANGGSAIVGKALAVLDVPRIQDDGPKGAGRMIGILERWIILGLVWAGQWGAVGLVLTAKSIARFKKMDEQAFAEVYLVGTMTSVLIAMASGALLKAALG